MGYKYTETFRTAHCDRYDILKGYARENRKSMTPAESKLWEELRGKKLGITFRRQHPIGDYIADFFAYKAKLIIEIDGGYHNTNSQKEEDEIRSHDIERLGYTILRFQNDEVFNSTNQVLYTIKQHIQSSSFK